MFLEHLFQFCEYYPDYEGCKSWIAKNLPDKFASLGLGDQDAAGDGEDAGAGGGGGEEGKKRQTRGGKGKVSPLKVTIVHFVMRMFLR